MGNAIPQWSIDVTNRLLATYVSPDRRLLDVEGFKAASSGHLSKLMKKRVEYSRIQLARARKKMPTLLRQCLDSSYFSGGAATGCVTTAC